MSEDRKDTPTPAVQEDSALDSLEDRLASARKVEAERLAADHAPMRDANENSSWAIASTMVGYPLGGIIIGFMLDNFFGTTPWITIGLMFTAFAGALLHVARITNFRADSAGEN